MALYEKRNRMPPHLAEIPYGFKNLWLISVSEYDLTGQKFLASSITRVVLNGAIVGADQLSSLYDYNRDGCSLIHSSSTTGLYVTLTDYDKDSAAYSFQALAGQSVEVYGVIRVAGDMVDNADPMRPVVGHDAQKLNVKQYNDDMTTLENRLTADEGRIQSNTDSIAEIATGTITGITLNETTAPVIDGVAQIEIDYVTPNEQMAALAAKVDKDIAGDGNRIVQSVTDAFDAAARELSIEQTLLSLEDGSTQTVTTTYALADLLGIAGLENIDKELFYFCPASLIVSFSGTTNVPLSSLYGINSDGTTYTPDTAEHIRLVYVISQDYSGYGVIARSYISAIGKVASNSGDTLACVFTTLQQIAIYNKYNGYRANTLVYNIDLKSVFHVLQSVPVPTTESNTIAITNPLYYAPAGDYSLMPADTVWANLEPETGRGNAYTIDETRAALLHRGAGYDGYVSFSKLSIPDRILTDADWSNNISLWVLDGMPFTTLDELLEHLSGFESANRHMASNRGIITIHYEAGGIVIAHAFTLDSISVDLAGVFQPIPKTATSQNLSVFDSNKRLIDSGLSPSAFATSAQGEKADTAIQSVTISSGNDDGTVKLTVDGNDQIAQVANLGSAAFVNVEDIRVGRIRNTQNIVPSSDIATIDLADTNIQNANIFKISPLSAISITLSNAAASSGTIKEFEIHITMGGIVYAVTWPSEIIWLSVTSAFEANKTLVFVFRANDENIIVGDMAYKY